MAQQNEKKKFFSSNNFFEDVFVANSVLCRLSARMGQSWKPKLIYIKLPNGSISQSEESRKALLFFFSPPPSFSASRETRHFQLFLNAVNMLNLMSFRRRNLIHLARALQIYHSYFVSKASFITSSKLF